MKHKRARVYFKHILSILLVLSAFRIASAQTLTTGNQFVSADVTTNGTGLFSIYLTGSQPKNYLTYSQQSFLSLQLDSQYYTNDWNNPTTVEPSGERVTPTYLGGGKTVFIKGVIPGTDTIRTTWEPFGPERFAIMQDIYPVEFQNSGQIVMKVSVRDFTVLNISAQAQYLLDLQTTDSNHATDAPGITTRNGFGGSTWLDLPLPEPYYITSQYPPCDTNFPGILGTGYTTDDLAPEPMGLLAPWNLVIVSWATIAQSYVWGFPRTLKGTPINQDNALLLQWPEATVLPGVTQEIARTSYGTTPCQPMCTGNLDLLTLHPEHIVWDGKEYIPNRFPVEAIVWNPSARSTTAMATQNLINSVTGQLSGPIKIITPITVSNDGYTQTQPVQTWRVSRIDSALACGSAYATWEDTVEAGYLTNCSTDSVYGITVSLPMDSSPCVCPIVVDCQEKQDTISPFPILTVLSRTGSFDGSICNARHIVGQASDPRMCALCGVRNVIATSLQNMTFAVEDSASWKFILTVVDSMQNGSATVQALDGTGSWDTAEYTYCTIPDTRAPLVRWNPVEDTCACFSFTVSDTEAWDRGLDTMALYNITGMVVDTITPNGKKIHGLRTANVSGHFPGQSSSTLCLSAIDLAGNRFDTCYVISRAGVQPSDIVPFVLSINPNPASSTVFISVQVAPSANVEIFDVLGRLVKNLIVTGSYEWNLDSFAQGTYIVRAETNGGVISKRLLKR